VAVIAPNARRLRVFAGHPGWSPGQLEGELDEGAWWVFRGGPDDLFSDDPRTMWRQVLRRQPSPVNLLSTYPADPTLN
jgi:putative transcriptional regulator